MTTYIKFLVYDLTDFYSLSIQVRSIRNDLYHSHDFSVTVAELKSQLKDMVALLEDNTTHVSKSPLLQDPSAKKEVLRLHEVNHHNCISKSLSKYYVVPHECLLSGRGDRGWL